MSAIDEAVTSLIPIASLLGIFSFLIVAIWVRHRRSEREIYYRHELLKQMLARGDDSEKVMALMNKNAPAARGNAREAARLSGLVLLAIGVGLAVALRWLAPDVVGVAAIPGAIGVALLVYGLATRRPEADRVRE